MKNQEFHLPSRVQTSLCRTLSTFILVGGSDPFIVCEDADIEKAWTGAAKGRFTNCGQSCVASKRFIVVKDGAEEFTEKYIQKTEKLKVGDPLSDDTNLGPVLNAKSVENMEGNVNRTIRSGAELLTG